MNDPDLIKRFHILADGKYHAGYRVIKPACIYQRYYIASIPEWFPPFIENFSELTLDFKYQFQIIRTPEDFLNDFPYYMELTTP